MVGSDYALGEMHSLMSLEAIDQYLTDFSNKFPKGIIPFYAKGKKEASIPQKLSEMADAVVWFDLYSTIPQVLKNKSATDNILDKIIEEWKKYITSIS
jgi:hypothetical protein